MARTRKRIRAFTVIFLLWVLTGCQSHQPEQQAAEPPVPNTQAETTRFPAPTYVPVGESALREFEKATEYVVSGQVTSEMGEALAGATVSLHSNAPRWSPPDFEQPEPLESWTADEQGVYEFRLKKPANLWVRISKEGYAAINAFIPVRDPSRAERDYQLRPAQAVIDGFVLDKEEMPVPGALVVSNTPLFASVSENPTPAPVGRITDANGKYTLEGLAEGELSLIATARGYSEQEELTSLSAGQALLLNIHVTPASPISFTVKNGRGDILPYATASAPGYFRIAGGNKGGTVGLSVPLVLGPFECTVAAEGYLAKTITLDPRDPPADVILEPLPVLKGRVLTEDGQPVAGALVSVLGTGGAQGKFDGAVFADKAGRFSVPLSYAPAREVRALGPGDLEQRIVFEAGKPVPEEVAIRLKPVEAGLYGRVIDFRGLPVKRFVLHLRDDTAAGGQDYQRSFSNDRGQFTVTDVAPGTYTLIIQSVPASTAETVQLLRMDQVEIRKGFLLGEIVAQFSPVQYGK